MMTLRHDDMMERSPCHRWRATRGSHTAIAARRALGKTAEEEMII